MRAEMKSLGLVLNWGHPEAGGLRERLVRQARQSGFRLECPEPGPDGRVSSLALETMASRVEGVVAAGGDGTLLSVVPAAAAAGIPVLGVNMGTLGFLTPVVLADAEGAVAAFAGGVWVPSERSLLEVNIVASDGRRSDLGVALNEATVHRRHVSRLTRFGVWVGGELVSSYSADGMIVATPTGSTAYSLSSNGPILTPDAPVICLTPICPHTLSNRPLVLSEEASVEVRPEAGHELAVTLDGRREDLVEAGGALRVAVAARRLTLALPRGGGFFELLRNKLHWRGSNT